MDTAQPAVIARQTKGRHGNHPLLIEVFDGVFVGGIRVLFFSVHLPRVGVCEREFRAPLAPSHLAVVWRSGTNAFMQFAWPCGCEVPPSPRTVNELPSVYRKPGNGVDGLVFDFVESPNAITSRFTSRETLPLSFLFSRVVIGRNELPLSPTSHPMCFELAI